MSYMDNIEINMDSGIKPESFTIKSVQVRECASQDVEVCKRVEIVLKRCIGYYIIQVINLALSSYTTHPGFPTLSGNQIP